MSAGWLGLLLAAAVPPLSGPLAAEVIEVPKVKVLPKDAEAAAWDKVPGQEVWVVAQQAIHLHDRRANPATSPAPRKVRVRAAHDGRRLAVALEWIDATEDRPQPGETASYADGGAIEFPLHFGAGQRLPHVGMGDPGATVVLFLQQAAAKGSALKALVGKGVGSTTRAPSLKVQGSMGYAEGRWRTVFLRELRQGGANLAGGLVPIALAVWDGARGQRGGNKELSGWTFLRLEGMNLDPKYTAQLQAEYDLGGPENPALGKQLVQDMCLTCHRLGEQRQAAYGLAPDLDGIGVWATPAFLRAAVVNPNEAILVHVNPNQHYLKETPPDSNGGYPNSSNYRWYSDNEEDGLVSKMPAFELEPAEISAMVGYLRSLGRPQ